MPRHEHVRADKRIYIDADAPVELVREILQDELPFGTTFERAALSDLDECPNCGNVPDLPSAVCPNCDFREIASCPNCGTPVARQAYESLPGDLCRCPSCQQMLRMKFNDPLWRDDGTLNEPTVVLEVP